VRVHSSSLTISLVHKDASDIVSFVILPSSAILHHLALMLRQVRAVESSGGRRESRESKTISVIVNILPPSILNLFALLLTTVTWVPELTQYDEISAPPGSTYDQ
jgi:hypothetical protein